MADASREIAIQVLIYEDEIQSETACGLVRIQGPTKKSYGKSCLVTGCRDC